MNDQSIRPTLLVLQAATSLNAFNITSREHVASTSRHHLHIVDIIKRWSPDWRLLCCAPAALIRFWAYIGKTDQPLASNWSLTESWTNLANRPSGRKLWELLKAARHDEFEEILSGIPEVDWRDFKKMFRQFAYRQLQNWI